MVGFWLFFRAKAAIVAPMTTRADISIASPGPIAGQGLARDILNLLSRL